jgi:spore coat polysaccharide biosynthesis protein SpsF
VGQISLILKIIEEDKMKTIAVVQARMRSSRLPGKVLLPLAHQPVLWWICARLTYAWLDEIFVATTMHEENDPIANNHCLPFGCHVFRYGGEEDDVIGRILATAEWANADVVVDITGDCPLVDPRHVNLLVRALKADNSLDYISNCVTRTWPDGLDVQAYKTRALAQVIALHNPKYHGGWNIAQYPDEFKIRNWPAPSDMHWPELGLTLDTPEDYELLRIIFEKFGRDSGFAVDDVINFLRNNPELVKINKNVRRKTPEEG